MGLNPCPEYLEMTMKRVKGRLEMQIFFIIIICIWMTQMASFLMRDSWKRNNCSFSVTHFFWYMSRPAFKSHQKILKGMQVSLCCLMFGFPFRLYRSLVSIAPGSKSSSLKKPKKHDCQEKITKKSNERYRTPLWYCSPEPRVEVTLPFCLLPLSVRTWEERKKRFGKPQTIFRKLAIYKKEVAIEIIGCRMKV